MTLDKIAKQVESLRAEVAELTARPPSIVVNRGDEIAVTGLDLLKSQVLLKVEAVPEPAKPDPAPPNPKCPMCGGRMRYYIGGDHWACETDECCLCGPNNDPDGSKVRKLVNIDKLPKVTRKQYLQHPGDAKAKWNHFSGHMIVADTKETP